MLSRIILKDLQILRCIDLILTVISLHLRTETSAISRPETSGSRKRKLSSASASSHQPKNSHPQQRRVSQKSSQRPEKASSKRIPAATKACPRSKTLTATLLKTNLQKPSPKQPKAKAKTSMHAASKKKLSGKGPSTQALELCLSYSAARGNHQQIHPHAREHKAGLVVQLIACPLDG